MINKFLRNYLSIIFIFATLLSVSHIHNDLEQHNDCEICTIVSNTQDIDTPTDSTYLSIIDIVAESPLKKLTSLHTSEFTLNLNARAPPLTPKYS